MVAATRRGAVPVGRDGLHAGRPCRASAPRPPISTRRARSASTGAPAPGYSRRGGFYGVTLHDYTDRDKEFGFRQVDYEVDPARPDPARGLGDLAPRLVQTTLRQGRSADPVLHAARTWAADHAARLQQLPLPRSNSLLLQAEWRIMVNRFMDTAVFYDAGKVTARSVGSRFQRAEERLRLRRALPRAVRDAAARRSGQEPEGLRLVFATSADFLRCRPCRHRHSSRMHAAPVARFCLVAALGLFAGARLDPASALLSGRSDRARARVAGRVEGAALRDRAAVRDGVQPVRHRRLQAVGHAREEHQHDRRGAGLELVHEPDRHDAGHRRRASRAGPIVGAPPDPSRWVLIREKTSGAHPGFTAQGCERRDLVPRVRSAVLPGRGDRRRGGRDEDLLGARLQPGRIVPDHVRSEARGDRPEGHDSPAVRREDPVHAGRHQRDPRTRRAKRGRHLSRHRRPADSRQDPRAASSTTARAPTIPTTSSRTSTAASCARCASSAPGRTSPISRRRTRSTRS